MANVEVQWTYTDEAPMLATHSLYPIMKAFSKSSGVDLTISDISVAGRVLALFENVMPGQTFPDELSNLGNLAKTPKANIIKLPNVSASIPQLKECIAELQGKGYNVPDFPEDPQSREEQAIREKYNKVLGSAVNPVLREGNSDRRAAAPVKNYAKKFPHKMGPWSRDSKSHVSHMTEGDFFGSEKSKTMATADSVRIEHLGIDGRITVLKTGIKLEAGEIIDGSCMNVRLLRQFFAYEIADAKAEGVLFSLHLKATMMKVSDPIMFGHCVSVFFKDVFAKHAATFAELHVNPNNGLGDVFSKIKQLPEGKRKEIEADIRAAYAKGPRLAMVNSDKEITGLHVPSDFIIDASMPSMIRGMDGLGGGMWSPDSKPGARDSHLCDAKAVIPDRCYAEVFKATIDFCKKYGAFDPAKMGSVPNVGLMAKKAEEYGSHDKTFEAPANGTIRIVSETTGKSVFEHKVEKGDIWRASQTKDIAVRDWVKLAVTRARACGWPAIFWLDANRAHDRQIIAKVATYLAEHDVSGCDFQIMRPVDACLVSLHRAREGLSTISVTGNVLRDYNTDLFPILELGTSAKMLSIVPLLAGGGMYETGAGGSAPKHVEQFQKESHLRWDSLGEFLAYAACLDDNAQKLGDARLAALGEALNKANEKFLDANKNPSRRVREIDNRGSHFYLALYWAQALSQSSNAALKAEFGPIAQRLAAAEKTITQELVDCQGPSADLGGYYMLDTAKADALMRPSATFNAIIDSM
eukprot:TRINITY_DN528_c0_g1_i2.p1 TRINITY_DN528_c0_g1~~TRINITY_DN528_c0_g1_i2.p1  ORF type:complete len:751 (+),score=207.53 TRINITY_DN528_c0_g1_i2:85-2337(+)